MQVVNNITSSLSSYRQQALSVAYDQLQQSQEQVKQLQNNKLFYFVGIPTASVVGAGLANGVLNMSFGEKHLEKRQRFNKGVRQGIIMGLTASLASVSSYFFTAILSYSLAFKNYIFKARASSQSTS